MNAQRREERHTDRLVIQINGMIAQLEMMRKEIEERNAAEQADRDWMLQAARGIAGKEFLTAKEVFEYLGGAVSLSAIQHGNNSTECLYRAKAKPGRSVKHLRSRVELHRQNMIERGYCGDCDQVNFGGPRRT
jgi:hypothetical protein